MTVEEPRESGGVGFVTIHSKWDRPETSEDEITVERSKRSTEVVSLCVPH